MDHQGDFVLLKQPGMRIWLRRKAMEALLEAVRAPDELFGRDECRIIKDQRKIKVGRFIVPLADQTKVVYVKKYNAFSRRYRWLSLLVPSGATRSLKGALMLARHNIPTASPLAAVESRYWGMLTGSYYLSEEIIDGKTADAYWAEQLAGLAGRCGMRRRRQFLSAIALMIQRLHERRIYHNDLKDANIIVAPDSREAESFFLLDLEGVRLCLFLSMRRKIKNLVQLNRTLGRYLARTQRLFFLKHYLGPGKNEGKILRSWVGQILRATQRADQRSRAKTSGQER
ncbi:MAG TPA: lipopolysaccharide kinase InaA family protein [Terriglobales bacterium]|nr:lipopolysaccharide kinase InaA family protein [Terriglobales bacterium]